MPVQCAYLFAILRLSRCAPPKPPPNFGEYPMTVSYLRARGLRDLRFSFEAILVLVALLAIGAALMAQPAKESTNSKIITVNEGTDLAIAVSPDHKTIVMDLQGMLYSLAIEGGSAMQLTAPTQEASRPDWSP